MNQTAISERDYAFGRYDCIGIGACLRRFGNHRSLLEAVFSRLPLSRLHRDLYLCAISSAAVETTFRQASESSHTSGTVIDTDNQL